MPAPLGAGGQPPDPRRVFTMNVRPVWYAYAMIPYEMFPLFLFFFLGVATFAAIGIGCAVNDYRRNRKASK